jgi:hypothetical protein
MILFKIHGISWLFVILFTIPSLVLAQNIQTIKVALTYNFSKYTQWPHSATVSEFNFCYFNDTYTKDFEKIVHKKIKTQNINTVLIEDINDLGQCNALYVDAAATEPKINAILSAVKNKAILTVSDVPDFTKLGGMIELVLLNNKLRFKVNMKEILNSQLKMSSHVLKLAIDVKR